MFQGINCQFITELGSGRIEVCFKKQSNLLHEVTTKDAKAGRWVPHSFPCFFVVVSLNSIRMHDGLITSFKIKTNEI